MKHNTDTTDGCVNGMPPVTADSHGQGGDMPNMKAALAAAVAVVVTVTAAPARAGSQVPPLVPGGVHPCVISYTVDANSVSSLPPELRERFNNAVTEGLLHWQKLLTVRGVGVKLRPVTGVPVTWQNSHTAFPYPTATDSGTYLIVAAASATLQPGSLPVPAFGRSVLAFVQPRQDAVSRELTSMSMVVNAVRIAYEEPDSPLEPVVLHELGHVLGLGHADDFDSIMQPATPIPAKPSAADADSMAALYKHCPLEPWVVSVVYQWKYDKHRPYPTTPNPNNVGVCVRYKVEKWSTGTVTRLPVALRLHCPRGAHK